MFQYATAYSLAQKYGTRVVINSKDGYSSNKNSQIIDTFELSNSVIGDFSGIKYQFKEKEFQFEDISSVPDQTDIVGYFQSERYFVSYRDKIIEKEFKFRGEILKKTDEVFQNIKSDHPICSVHIRRGDYLSLSETHPPLSADYYERAIRLLPTSGDLLVFSDNIEEAKILLENSEMLRSLKKTYISEDYKVELCLMSKCDYHVIANSSFSWWGAWLSNSKRVVAPKQWFGPRGPKKWDDIYCRDWLTT